MMREDELEIQPECLKWHEVKWLDHVKKDAYGVACILLASILNFAPLRPIFYRWIDVRLCNLTGVHSFRDFPFFALHFEYAQRLFGPHLELRVPVSDFTHRLHDWIEYGGFIQHASSHFLCMGDWQNLLASATSNAVMREAIQVHKSKLQYTRTKVYERFKMLAHEGKPVWRNQIQLNSQERIDDYFQRFVSLFESVRDHGVLPIGGFRGTSARKFQPSASRKRKTEWGERDIGVAIGPDGELVLLPGGKHRLAVATVLQVSHVPVQVRMVHVDWLRRLPRQPGQTWRSVIAEGIDAVRRQYAQASTGREGC